jgi:PAS domain S-box-containing protein
MPAPSPSEPAGHGESLFWETFHLSADAKSASEIESGRFIDVNARFAELTGFDRAELIGRTSQELNLWVDVSDRAPLIERLKVEE